MPIAAASPNPEPAPVIKIVFGIVVSWKGKCRTLDALHSGKGARTGVCDLGVLHHRTARHADRAKPLAIGAA
jgi:hypothetical protein